MKEQDYTYDLYTELSCLNEQHVLKPYIYQNLFSQVVGRHLKNIGSDFETLGRDDLAWVLVALSMEIKKPITGAMHLIAQSWYSQHRGPVLPQGDQREKRTGRDHVLRQHVLCAVQSGDAFGVPPDGAAFSGCPRPTKNIPSGQTPSSAPIWRMRKQKNA